MWWRLKSWLSDLGVWLWFNYGSKKTYIAFRHTECGSEIVLLADFRSFGPEFQCFQCNALVPAKDITFRILPTEEAERIGEQEKDRYDEQYFKQGVWPYIVA